MKKVQIIVAGLLVGAGLVVLGCYINKGLQSFSNKERVVAVKGLAEKNIKATEAKITISTSFSGDNVKELIEKIDKRIEALAAYVKEKGYADVKIGDLDIYDSKSYYDYHWNGEQRIQVKKDRYNASKLITITLKDVEKARTASKTIDLDLINKDLSSEVGCNYKFPELNTIKPELIAESTKNARLSGEQFAKDSQSKLGKIKTASQGQITLAGRYYYDDEETGSAPEEPYLQKARVVSTIVFYLED
jgi:hypothetical protein